jgi:manganese/zinc/iron transport system permease protein
VILISRYAGDVHLDTDAVLLGELAFAPFDRFAIAGTDIGPKALWLMGGILVANAFVIAFFFKELKLVAFDTGLAAALGFSPTVIHYLLMTQVSITAVGAFDAVGSILVVALMIAPPATAYLLTDNLGRMIIYSVVTGILSAIGGYWLAHSLDVSIAGCMAVVSGMLFGVAFLVAPGRGLLVKVRRRQRQKWEFAVAMLTIHLSVHEGLPEAATECRADHLTDHLNWSQEFADRVLAIAVKDQQIVRDANLLKLTDHGRQQAEQALIHWAPAT